MLCSNLMPVLCGPSAAKKMREIGYRGLIFGATGNALPEDIRDYINHGADHVLIKPISLLGFKEAYMKFKG